MKNLYYYDSTILGRFGIVEENGKIIKILMNNDKIDFPFIFMETELIQETYKQIIEFFNKKRSVFNIPIYYENRIFDKIIKIPYGQIINYNSLLEKFELKEEQLKDSFMNNPLPILIPTHRVIENNDDIGEYKLGKDLKTYLLVLEKANIEE